jgi:hypothetical protein
MLRPSFVPPAAIRELRDLTRYRVDLLSRADVDPDRGSFTVALNAARDQVIKAAGVITDPSLDLVGTICRAGPGPPVLPVPTCTLRHA